MSPRAAAPALTIAVGPLTAVLSPLTDKVWKLASALLTCEVPGFEHVSSYKRGRWDGKKRFLSITGAFPSGFAVEMANMLSDEGYGVVIQYADGLAHLARELPVVLPQGLTLRDYQMHAVRVAITERRGILRAVTGSGKTLMGCSIAASVLHPHDDLCGLWLTHTKDLLLQSREVFDKRFPQIKSGIIGDGKWEPGQMTFATVQTLARRIKERQHVKLRRASQDVSSGGPLDMLDDVALLIADEAHLANADQFQEVFAACKNARWRLGLTATPDRREELPNMLLRAATGGIIVNIGADILIKRGLLAEPHISFVLPGQAPRIPGYVKWPACYDKGITENKDRNKAVCMTAIRHARAGLPTLVLVRKIEHGVLLERALSHFVKARFAHGKQDAQTRQDAFKALGDGTIQVLVGSGIMNMGIDIPEIGSIVIAAGGKSSVNTIQRIGRGMRATGDKSTVLITDFLDVHHPVLLNHSKQRLIDCQSEPGYVVAPLPDAHDLKHFLPTMRYALKSITEIMEMAA